jgi:hypothetical protein
MRAIMVCVDYSDLLAITLPRNRHHFDEVWVVTSFGDKQTRDVCRANDARIFCTDAFWDGGAQFNKWKALEQGLDRMGRGGWLCLMDADVIWPKSLGGWSTELLYVGTLCSPLRRMLDPLPMPFLSENVPDERDWNRFPIHRNVNEWAGYSQMFHANDLTLGDPPWHDICWRHAGGADSFFQARWRRERKIRPPWECLHLGSAGENWCGRASRLMDGKMPDGAEEKRAIVAAMWRERRKREGLERLGRSLPGGVFGPEKL